MYAVFPLSIVVLPNESVALHLFEPRYRELFRDYKDGDEFAIVMESEDGLSEYGTLVYIDKVINEFPDDTVDVIVKGSSIIKVNQFHEKFPNKLYSGVDAEIVEVSNLASPQLTELFKLYMENMGKRVSKSQDVHIFSIANRLELSKENKNKLISFSSNAEMNCYLMNEIRFLGKIREQEDLLQQKFHLN